MTSGSTVLKNSAQLCTDKQKRGKRMTLEKADTSHQVLSFSLLLPAVVCSPV